MREQKKRFDDLRFEEYIIPHNKLRLWTYIFVQLEEVQRHSILWTGSFLQYGMLNHIGPIPIKGYRDGRG